MSIQGFNIEEDNEEIRDEIEEGVNMYEEEKIEPRYDIKLTIEEVNNMEPGVIISKSGLKITGELVEEIAVDLIKNISNQVFMVDSLTEDMLNAIREEAAANKIEDAEEVTNTPEPEITEEVIEEVVEETIEHSDIVDLNQGTVNMDLDSMFSDDDIIDEDTVTEDDILEITEDGDGYINPATGEVELFDNMTEALTEEVVEEVVEEEVVEEEVVLPIDGDRTVDTLTDTEINQIATQVLSEAAKDAPVRDASYIKDTNYTDDTEQLCRYIVPMDKYELIDEEFRGVIYDIQKTWLNVIDATIKIIKEINTGVIDHILIKYNYNHVTLTVNTKEIPIHTLLLSYHGDVMLVEDGIGSITGVIEPNIVNYDTRFRNVINCKWNHNYDTYVIKAENEAGVLVDQTIVVSKDNADMQEYFYKPIAATIEASIPHALDNGHIASQSLTQEEYDNLEDKVVTIEHLDPIRNEMSPFIYAIKKVITPIQGMTARNVQLIFQRLQLIGESYYVAGVYYSPTFIETVKEVTI